MPSTPDATLASSLDEIALLAGGLGLQVTTRVVQKRDKPAAATYLGEGKLAEVAALTGGSGKVPRGPDAPPPEGALREDLAGSEVLVEDKLFATLETAVRPLRPPTTPPILLVDSIGFINRLPHQLIGSFRATLAEAKDAWLLLAVVDAADPDFRLQLSVTQRALREIGANGIPTWIVFNKVDKLTAQARRACSAKSWAGILR